MYDQYTEINKIIATVPEIKQLHRCSGISEMEETLQEKLREMKTPLLVAEDDGNGYLSIEGRNLDGKYLTFYLLTKPEAPTSEKRKAALLVCRKAALKLLKKMKAKSLNFGDPFYGFDFSRIDYQQLGPIANGLHGYSFSYLFRDENFNLVDPEP